MSETQGAPGREPAHEHQIVGAGQVGGRFEAALSAAGARVDVVTRTSGWEGAIDAGRSGSRILAMREDDLPAALARFPRALLERLVLVQNGFLEPQIADALVPTRALVWFTSKPGIFEVLAPTLLHGPFARELAEALAGAGIAAEALSSREDFLVGMIVKGVWNNVVGLPLAVHEQKLGDYLDAREDEWRAIVEETARASAAYYGVRVDPDACGEELLRTTRPIRGLSGGAKALSWRNGAVAFMGRATGEPTPVNDRLLAALGEDPARFGALPPLNARS